MSKHLTFTIAIFLLLILNGCTNSASVYNNMSNEQIKVQKEYNKAEFDKQMNKTIKCQKTKAKELDDKVSDAVTISKAVTNACRSDAESSAQLFNMWVSGEFDMNINNNAMYKSLMNPHGSTLEYVLRNRNKKL